MKIIKDTIALSELKEMTARFGDMVKAVIDVAKELAAVDAELHSDLEALLLQNGSKQKDLWGINIYPEMKGDDFIEFDSLINLRPSQNNRTRGIDNKDLQKQIIDIVKKKVKK